jgi:hypothetical protein
MPKRRPGKADGIEKAIKIDFMQRVSGGGKRFGKSLHVKILRIAALAILSFCSVMFWVVWGGSTDESAPKDPPRFSEVPVSNKQDPKGKKARACGQFHQLEENDSLSHPPVSPGQVEPQVSKNQDPDIVTKTEGVQMTRAIIHVGPHKTGSTSIQQTSRTHMTSLQKDGYFMPWSLDPECFPSNQTLWKEPHLKLIENQVHFATCFIPTIEPEAEAYPCNTDLLRAGQAIGEQNRNIFISAETFSRIDAKGLQQLSEYLKPWDEVTFIVFYRRYYSFLASIYNQLRKRRTLAQGHLWKESVLDFLLSESHDLQAQFHHTAQLQGRIEQQFGGNNIIVFNFHNKTWSSPAEAVFCHGSLNTVHTCHATRNESVHANRAKDLAYEDLVFAAANASLIKINTDEEMKHIANAAQSYQEKTLNKTSNDFPKICLSPEDKKVLLDKSLELERRVYPETFSLMEIDTRLDFEAASQTSLCDIDVDGTLLNDEWIQFFQRHSST